MPPRSYEDLLATADDMLVRPPLDLREGERVAADFLSDLNLLGRRMEEEGASPDSILLRFQAIRDHMARSPLLHHLQAWPRGYQGDYTVIEKVLHLRNDAEEQSWAWFLEQASLSYPIVQQHRNKIAHQSQACREVLLERGVDAVILSLGCGGARDIELAIEATAVRPARVVLNDQDQDALALAMERLSPLSAEIATYPVNVLRAVARLRKERVKSDLVLIGGLFDYLSDRAIATILEAVYRDLLKPGGRIVFTNIAGPNPYRYLMQYAVTWHIIERTRSQMEELLLAARIPLNECRIFLEESGLAWIVECRS